MGIGNCWFVDLSTDVSAYDILLKNTIVLSQHLEDFIIIIILNNCKAVKLKWEWSRGSRTF